MSILRFPPTSVKSAPPLLPVRLVPEAGKDPRSCDSSTRNTLYLAVAVDEIIDYGVNPSSLAEDVMVTFPEAEDLALWMERDFEPPRLIGYIRPGPDGRPKLTWL